MKKLLILTAAIFAVYSATGQSKTVNAFLEEHPELKKYYIYQSTLRMANTTGDENFNRLIKDVRKINVYLAQGTGEVSEQSYDDIIDGLKDESFETLITAKYEGSYINLMSRSKGSSAYYILALHNSNDFGLMEMDGDLDLQYLAAVSKMDFNKLTNMVMEGE